MTITITDPSLPTPTVVEIPERYVTPDRLDVVCAYATRGLQEWALRRGWSVERLRMSAS